MAQGTISVGLWMFWGAWHLLLDPGTYRPSGRGLWLGQSLLLQDSVSTGGSSHPLAILFCFAQACPAMMEGAETLPQATQRPHFQPLVFATSGYVRDALMGLDRGLLVHSL